MIECFQFTIFSEILFHIVVFLNCNIDYTTHVLFSLLPNTIQIHFILTRSNSIEDTHNKLTSSFSIYGCTIQQNVRIYTVRQYFNECSTTICLSNVCGHSMRVINIKAKQKSKERKLEMIFMFYQMLKYQPEMRMNNAGFLYEFCQQISFKNLLLFTIKYQGNNHISSYSTQMTTINMK